MGQETQHTVSCKDSLDISIAGEFYAELKEALSSGKPVSLIGEEVMRADTSCLQILCAFFKESRQAGMQVEWVSPSEQLREAAQAIGVSEHLGLA